MQRIFGCLRAVCRIFLVFLLVASDSGAATSSDDKLELWFEYNGHQATLVEPPQVSCFSQSNNRAVKCDLYHSDDARYWITRPVVGSYNLYVTATKDGEEYYRAYSFEVDDSTTGPLLVALNRVLRLQQSSAAGKPHSEQAANCDAYDKYKVPLLALFSVARLDITWNSLPETDHYHYRIWRVRCADDLRIEPVLMGSSQNNTLQENIPANEVGEYYSLELYARHGNQDIGQLLPGGSTGITRDTYSFVINDSLGDRSWFPYLFLILLVPFLLWMLWWMLRAAASIHPGKGFAWALLVIILVTAGYLQQQTLQTWLGRGGQWLQQAGQFSQKWYRRTAKDDGYTVHKSSSSGDWGGYLVAIGDEPFYGAHRRMEIRISFGEETARVRLLQEGHWRDVTDNAFRLSRSGTGMTLIGHIRDGKDRELWSISIPDIHETELRPVFDRLITRHNVQNGRTETVRRQAVGELYHGLTR